MAEYYQAAMPASWHYRHAVLLSRDKVRNHVCGADEVTGEVGADCLKLLKGCQ